MKTYHLPLEIERIVNWTLPVFMLYGFACALIFTGQSEPSEITWLLTLLAIIPSLIFSVLTGFIAYLVLSLIVHLIWNLFFSSSSEHWFKKSWMGMVGQSNSIFF